MSRPELLPHGGCHLVWLEAGDRRASAEHSAEGVPCRWLTYCSRKQPTLLLLLLLLLLLSGDVSRLYRGGCMLTRLGAGCPRTVFGDGLCCFSFVSPVVAGIRLAPTKETLHVSSTRCCYLPAELSCVAGGLPNSCSN